MDGLPPSPEQALEAAGAIVTRFVPKPVGRFQVRSFNQCRVDHASRYLIKGILAPRDFGLIFGQPGCGKSLAGPLLCHAVAEGRRVFGRRTRKSRVLYIAAEAGADMEVRFCAMRERYGDVEGLDLIAVPIDLQDQNSGDIEYLLAEIARLKPDLIVVDTIAAAFPGLEENEARDMGRAVRILRSLTEPSGAAVLAIHHAPKEGNTPRGWGGLNGDADVTMRVEGQDDQPRSVTFGKNRNGPSGHAFTFGLELVELGEDQDGDPIRRPVAVELDEDASQQAGDRGLTETERGWLRELVDMFAEPGAGDRVTPFASGPSVIAMTREQVREGYRKRGRFEAGPDAPLTGADRERMRSMLNKLKDKRKIGLSADLVWLL